MQYNLIDRIAHGGEYTMEEADLNDLREMVIGILYVIAYIVSAVTFIQWFRRAYYNLHLLVPRLNREEGWAARELVCTHPELVLALPNHAGTLPEV